MTQDSEKTPLTRRRFLGAAAGATAAMGLGTGLSAETLAPQGSGLRVMPGVDQLKARKASGLFKGFIVSDAHFGWQHPAQPENDTIRRAVWQIMDRFPDLDVFIDSGDAHHGNSNDQGRRDWCSVIQSSIGTLPFFFIAGNHDIISTGSPSEFFDDPERRSNALGSVTARPYYSFDCKGVHVVGLPELINPNLVTAEAMAWLALDLDLNRDRTTIIVSHNSIADTTRYHDSRTYRRLANSREMLEMILRHPNVVAWMHGHNHTWELVPKHDRFFVSNGRIGGFSPPYEGYFGADHLGGIYFEVGPGHFTVRGYSATSNCFFDALPGYKHMTGTMKGKTSLDPAATFAHSFGMGGMRDGLRMPVWNHHAGGSAQLFLAGAADPVFSENTELEIWAEQKTGWSKSRNFPALAIAPRENIEEAIDGIEPTPEGMRVLPLPGGGDRMLFAPDPSMASRCYYDAAPGRTYMVTLTAKSEAEPVVCSLSGAIHNRHAERIDHTTSTPMTIGTETTMLSSEITVPTAVELGGIYTDPLDETTFQVAFSVNLPALTSPVVIERLAIQEKGATDETRDPALTICGRQAAHSGSLGDGERVVMDVIAPVRGHDYVEARAGGNRRMTWLMRQTGLAWQVRNAPVVEVADGLRIGPVRNPFSLNEEIIIVPLDARDEPFVHRTRHIRNMTVHPLSNGSIRIEGIEPTGNGPAEIEVTNIRNPAGVSGAARWDHQIHRLVIFPQSGENVMVQI